MKRDRGVALVGMLVAVLIIAVAFALLYGRRSEPVARPVRPGGPTSALGQDLDRGRSVDCMNNLKQIRMAIDMEQNAGAETGQPPQSLSALSKDGITPQMLQCPVTGKPYQYDPRTGVVSCVTPGHEKL